MNEDHAEKTYILAITVHGKPENLPSEEDFACQVNNLLGYRNLGEYWLDKGKVRWRSQ